MRCKIIIVTICFLLLFHSSGIAQPACDHNCDGRCGLEDVIKILQIVTQDVKPTLNSIKISGADAINEKSSANYTAAASFSDGSTKDVTNLAVWSENSAYANFDASVKGKLITSDVPSDQTITVTASFTQEGIAKNESKTVMIKNIPPSLISISISGSALVNEKSSANYTATALFSDDSTKDVTSLAVWNENSSYANFDASVKGKLITSDVPSDQTITVTASFTQEGIAKSESKTVTIKNIPPTLISISISGSASVNEKSSANYTATALFSDDSTKDVTTLAAWSENSAYANFDPSVKGKLITSDVPSNQTITITASYSMNDIVKTASKTVTITDSCKTVLTVKNEIGIVQNIYLDGIMLGSVQAYSSNLWNVSPGSHTIQACDSIYGCSSEYFNITSCYEYVYRVYLSSQRDSGSKHLNLQD